MTVVKNMHTLRQVLDFSGEHYSKNQVKKILRALELSTIEYSKEHGKWIIHNSIKVGMYTIHLIANPQEGVLKLKDLGVILISIYEGNRKLPITLDKDGRFKHQYWVRNNIDNTFKIKHLIDAIMHCQRLDGLKAFL